MHTKVSARGIACTQRITGIQGTRPVCTWHVIARLAHDKVNHSKVLNMNFSSPGELGGNFEPRVKPSIASDKMISIMFIKALFIS